jgi:hypothetical protein
MSATPVAQAGPPIAGNPSIEQALDVLQKRLELLRVDATLMEFEACRSRNERLITWYRGRRAVLAHELALAEGAGL